MKPIVVVNFKTYKQGAGVLRLAKALGKVDRKVIFGVQASDVVEVVGIVKNPVYVQHVDYREVGKNTGFVLPEAVGADGAVGVFLNHSEHKISFKDLEKSVDRCRKVGLKVLVFAGSLGEARKIKKLKPDYLVVEPPELVGGTKSVSSVKGYVKKLADGLKCDFLVGAGIKNGDDVRKAIELGASGVAVASGVVLARSPGKALKDLI